MRTEPLNYASFFTGIGGGDLAAEWLGWNIKLQCEINSFCQTALKYYWPNATLYEDIKKTNFKKHRGTIDVLSGGFPCQGFSVAGQRLGTEDDRYLWPEMLRAIREIQPIAVVGENVTGILSMEDKSGIWSEVFPRMESRKITSLASVDRYEAIYTRQAHMLIDTICEDLEKEGYQVQPFIIPAAGIAAPHKRDRIWIVAYTNIGSKQKHGFSAGRKMPKGTVNRIGITANASVQGLQKWIKNGSGKDNERFERSCDMEHAPNAEKFGLQGSRQANGSEREKSNDKQPHGCSREWIDAWEQWPTQSPLCSRNDGLPSRLAGITFSKHRNESIKGYGNAQVPQINYQLYKAIESLIL